MADEWQTNGRRMADYIEDRVEDRVEDYIEDHMVKKWLIIWIYKYDTIIRYGYLIQVLSSRLHSV